MKTLTTLSLIGALALSTTAFADDSTPEPTTPSASKQCRTERSAMGLELFRMTYGTNKNKRNAFGKCVSKRTHATTEAAKEAKQNASKDCTAEETADPAAFTAKYGTGKHGANAHGKCVSQKAKAETAKTVQGRRQGRRQRREGVQDRAQGRPGRVPREVRHEQEQAQCLRQVRLQAGQGAALLAPLGQRAAAS